MVVWFSFFLGIIGALVHEGRGSRSEEEGSDDCGYSRDSPPGDDFGESAELYARVYEIYMFGKLWTNPNFQ